MRRDAPHTRTYIQRAKGQVQKLLSQRGLSQQELCAMTGIPRANLQRWLSIRNEGFMTLRDAAVIGETLGVSIHALLPEPCWLVSPDQERAAMLRRIEALPDSHLRALLDCYAVITAWKGG